MERLIRYFVDRHFLVHLMVAVIVVTGYLSASRANRETFPNVTIPTLMVTATLPGASARDVETKIAIPIQEAVEDLDGVKSFHSVVTDNTAITTVELYDGLSDSRILEAERDLSVLLDAIKDFPPEMEDEPTTQRLNPQKFPVIQIALSGPTDAVIRAGKLLERRLNRLDTVSRVILIGLQDPEVRVLVDPSRAREHGVTLLDVVDAVKRRNVSSTGGMLKTAAERRQVVLWSRFDDPSQVGETIIRFLPSGGALRVRDVGRIEVGREDTGLIAHTNAEPGISIVVRKRENADIVDTVDQIRETVNATVLPSGVSASFVKDESFMARNRLDLMFTNGALGAALVAIVLFVFLTPLAAVWVLVALPVVFLGTIALFPIIGFSINMVTLTAFVVVLGMVVDDAVVISERAISKWQEGLDQREAAVVGATEMSRPVIASAITTMLAFLPLWALGGMTGKMIFSLPAVVMTALGLSLLESLFILPGHMSMAMSVAKNPKRAFMTRLEGRYRRMLGGILEHRVAVLIVFFAALVAILVFVAPRLGIQLFPQDDSAALYIKFDAPLGTPIEKTESVVAAVERQLPAILGNDLAAVTARIGHQQSDEEGGDRERGTAENEAVINAQFIDVGREKTSAEWIEVLERELIVPSDVRITYVAEIMGPPVGQPVTIHVAANADALRRGTALEIADWLRSVGGVANIDVDERPGTPQIELNLDYRKLALRGLDAEIVGMTLKAAFHGIVASEHRQLDETTEYRVLFDPAARQSLEALLETPIRARNGSLVRMRDVVQPIEVPAVQRIYHRDGLRTATVRAQFTAGSPHTALSMAAVAERDLFPRYAGVDGLDVYYGGEAVETRKTTADMGIAALLAFAGITTVIALMLGSFLEASFVVAIIPFSLAGVVLTFFLHGQSLSMFAMMGTVGLAGVVVNASIVMVDAIHRNVGALSDPSPRQRMDAIVDAVVSRLRPVLVTTLTTLGGVLPTAYGLGGYDAMVSPMSLALGWGLAFSTLVTLVLVPTLYTVANDLRTALQRTGRAIALSDSSGSKNIGPMPPS